MTCIVISINFNPQLPKTSLTIIQKQFLYNNVFRKQQLKQKAAVEMLLSKLEGKQDFLK